MIFGEMLSQLLDSSQMTIIYRKTVNNEDIESLHMDLSRLHEWAVENEIKMNPTRSKTVCFLRA
jgi:hypothetical protein